MEKDWTYFKDLLNTMWRISLRVKLASNNVFKKFSPRHPANSGTLKKEHLLKIVKLDFKEKLLLDEGTERWLGFWNFQIFARLVTFFLFTYNIINAPRILEDYAIPVLNTLSPVECVVNFYESPQTHSWHLWWALTLANDPTPHQLTLLTTQPAPPA